MAVELQTAPEIISVSGPGRVPGGDPNVARSVGAVGFVFYWQAVLLAVRREVCLGHIGDLVTVGNRLWRLVNRVMGAS